MTLPAGTRIGVYEVVELVGAGGMGEVYRALDTRLRRDVALKVLPASLASEGERLLRFAREAEMLAALNHPNIAAIYGVEDSGPDGQGIRALVMELVAGETLADQIARGPLPLAEALPIARQIAVALEAAHEQGIVHRDLKPANIKLREDGTVKVLDFGLAKLADPIGGPGSGSSMTLSPTITSPALMTNAGMLLGTAAYMSPEQAKGRSADRRSDMWAFGCVLFEMLTGKRAFEGEDVSETLAAVLRGDPDWAALPGDTPPAIRTLMRRCLERDRRKRVADSAAALFVLDEHPNLVADAPPPDYTALRREKEAAITAERQAAEARARRRLWFGGAAAMILMSAAIAGVWWATRPEPPRTTWLALPVPPSAVPTMGTTGNDLALTSDGSQIVYFTGTGAGQDPSSLAVKSLDNPDVRPLNTIQGGIPFVSPDDMWIGFYDTREDTIKKISILGGSAVPVVAKSGAMRGATWLPDDTIVYGTVAAGGLSRVPASGGTPSALTQVDTKATNETHMWPQVLPGGRALVFAISTGSVESSRIAVLNLETKQHRVIVPRGTYPKYSPTGHLLYADGGTLFAVGFDLETLTSTTTPTPLPVRVHTKSSGAALYDIAANGTLAYVAGGAAGSSRSIALVDRQGVQHPLPNLAPGDYRSVRVSPDGRHLAYEAGSEGQGRLWIYDVARGTRTALTTGGGDDRNPLWTTDGKRIVFGSNRDGRWGVFVMNADGTGAIERLTTYEKASEVWPDAWGPNGTLLVATNQTGSGADIDVVSFTGKAPELNLKSEAAESHPAISPNGKWLAYMAIRPGVPAIYAERFPGLGDRQTISTDRGMLPLWSRNGRELFYLLISRDQLMVVPVETRGDRLVAGAPTPSGVKGSFFALRGWRSYDQMPDGRFVMILDSSAGGLFQPVAPQVVQHFSEELRKRVP